MGRAGLGIGAPSGRSRVSIHDLLTNFSTPGASQVSGNGVPGPSGGGRPPPSLAGPSGALFFYGVARRSTRLGLACDPHNTRKGVEDEDLEVLDPFSCPRS